MYFSRLGHRVHIDLYRPDTLNGFGRTGLNYLLMVVGAMALTTVQAIDQEFRAENYLNALYVAAPAALAHGPVHLLPLRALCLHTVPGLAWPGLAWAGAALMKIILGSYVAG